jgi:D-alanyl-lipoteichoic acid acyltransferase DltB (MBOAT superfamily)
MPLGLSFYTFQHIASWVKVRQEDWDAPPHVLDYLIYTMYFPKLISGPVEKWESFHTQLAQLGNLELDTQKITQGLRYILWGAFAKWTIAPLVHSFYLMLWTETPSLFGFLLAGVFNFLNIYTDFSGYSNFVMGISLLFSIELTQNFKFPIFTNDVRNFWQRWHISFTQWILDYLYTPLAFSMRSWGKKGIALAIVSAFLIVGLWHRLETNYIFYGLIHGLYFLPILLKWNWSEKLALAKKKSALLDQWMILPFFVLMSTTALIFSSSSWGDFVAHLMHVNGMMDGVGVVFSGMSNVVFLLLIIGFLAIEWWNKLRDFGLDISNQNGTIRWSLYFVLIVALFTWGEFKNIGTLYAHF